MLLRLRAKLEYVTQRGDDILVLVIVYTVFQDPEMFQSIPL